MRSTQRLLGLMTATLLIATNGHATVRMHNVFPRFSETPGAIEWAGGELGQGREPEVARRVSRLDEHPLLGKMRRERAIQPTSKTRHRSPVLVVVYGAGRCPHPWWLV